MEQSVSLSHDNNVELITKYNVVNKLYIMDKFHHCQSLILKKQSEVYIHNSNIIIN